MRRTDKIAIGVLLAVIAAAVVGLVAEGVQSQFFTPVLAPCPTEAAATEIPGGSVAAEHAAPFAGPGPHPVLLVDPTDLDVPARSRWKMRDLEVRPAALPPQAVPRRDGDGAPVGVQLVVCMYQLPDAPVRIGTCHYVDRDDRRTEVAQVAPRYAYVVREARTGTALDRFELSASSGDCPLLHSAGDPAVAVWPDRDEVWRKLSPLVTGSRP